MPWQEIVPFQNRGQSGAATQNFLARNQQVFLMDNHRAALWCWLQCLRPDTRFNFLHIDAHWDCMDMITPDIWRTISKPVFEMTIEEYLREKHPSHNFELFRWDNYIPPFLENYSQQISRTYTACHGIGSEYEFDEYIKAHHILGALENIFDGSDEPKWIINIDCDYFFATQRKAQLYTDAVIKDVGFQVRKLMDSGNLVCCTIALSPECCGGWAPAERVASIITAELGVPYTFP